MDGAQSNSLSKPDPRRGVHCQLDHHFWMPYEGSGYTGLPVHAPKLHLTFFGKERELAEGGQPWTSTHSHHC